MDDNNICDDCIYCENEADERPCNICMQWVEGYLEATQYTNKFI